MTPLEICLTVLISVAVVLMCVCIGILAYMAIKFFYIKWIVKNSEAIRVLRTINDKYTFIEISKRKYDHAYDCEHNYYGVSPEDYLIYQLAEWQYAVKKDINLAKQNLRTYEKYSAEVREKCTLIDYSKIDAIVFKKFAQKLENKEINKRAHHPTTLISIDVVLRRVTRGKQELARKKQTFDQTEILELIARINNVFNRYDGSKFYKDRGIWDAICRVERAKVSNAMRFSIFARDGHKCRKCGRRNNLEIDHIIPIAKGGKSVYDNLQTLCHRCNVEKGSRIE